MKIIKYILLFLLFPLGLSAQQEMGDPGKTWSYPVIYKYDEQVTWFFDLSTTSFSEGQNLYLWIWSPAEPDAGNWGNSSEFAKLKYEGNMVWSFTLTPTVYFNKTAAEIAASAGFWFRLKDKTGSQQSGVARNIQPLCLLPDCFRDLLIIHPEFLILNTKSLPTLEFKPLWCISLLCILRCTARCRWPLIFRKIMKTNRLLILSKKFLKLGQKQDILTPK